MDDVLIRFGVSDDVLEASRYYIINVSFQLYNYLSFTFLSFSTCVIYTGILFLMNPSKLSNIIGLSR